MKNSRHRELSIEIDKLSNSIENALTSEIFETRIEKISTRDSQILEEAKWEFNWQYELKDSTKLVFGLVTIEQPKLIQGLLSIEDKMDHIFIHLIESAYFNKGKEKLYLGVPANLVAFACKMSMDKGYQGFVAFDAKSSLIKHYQKTLNATHFKGLRMYIDSTAAAMLIDRYYNK